MSKHGKYQLNSPMEQRFHEKAMAAQLVFRCEFCAAWAEGPARDVLLFATDHRAINHVGAVDRGSACQADRGESGTDFFLDRTPTDGRDVTEREYRLLQRVIELERRLRLAQSGKAKQKARALLWRTRALRNAK